ncbi:Integrase catalytic domain-containing protein [Citrus sinensis]|nr:Integrase catalytic domain-containing protein [Citrus sinensis]
MDALIQIDFDVVLKNKRHLYDEEIWDRMNKKACGQIISCLTKEVKYLVKDEECAVTLWRTFEEKYLVKSPENCLHAMSQVYGFRMKPGVSMHNHVSRFEKLLADLKNLDEDIKDEVKAMILLHSLPEEYSHFVTTLIYGKSVIVFKDVCTALTSLEIRNNDKNSERASSKALRKDCPKAQKRDEKKPAAEKMARKDEGSDYSLSITPAAYVASSSELILDTGATYHLCPIKEWFTDFRNLESGAVVMGNDQPCALEAKGYKVTIEDGTMKFTHGAMVILQGVRRHNLYYLKGGTTDKANVVEAHSDITKLWHVRLGHAGEKSLQTLMRHELLKGPTNTASIGGSHYFVTFVDHFSRRVWVYTMRAKDEVLEIFMKWKKLVETQTDRKIKVLRSDNGGEYTSDPFLQLCQNEGIKRHFTVRHTPQQNGVAERMNRTLLEKVRCMLSNAGLDKKFWAEAVSYASHLVNRLPSAAIGGKTPMEMWSGKHAQNYDSLRIFECPVYYHVKDGKLDPRARKAIFVGFKDRVKGFKLWDLEDKKFVCSRNVTFDEASMMKASSSQQVENKTKEVLQRVEFDATPYVPVSFTSKKCSTMEVTPRVEEEVVSSDVPQNKETIDDVDNDDFIATRRPRREIKKFGWLTKDMVVAYALPVIDDDIPNTFVAEYELELAQLDVKTAFLHADLEEEIYMIQPCGFRVTGKENHVCRLIKSLYGLKQSPRQWYKRFDQFIQGQKFTRSEHDHCVYFRRLTDGAFIYLLLYVDDMLIASKNRDEIERLKKQLASEFEIKDLGDAQRILGMKIRRDKKNGSVWLTQKSYLKKVLERFGMDDKTKPVCTPLAPHFKLSSSSCPRSQEERDYMARVPYASVVGSLMYVMVCTRPDISQAVSMVSRYMHNPGKNQWLAVKWILRYLYGTVDVGLLFKKDFGQQCVGYCNSDFTGDLDKRRSTTGYVFTLGGGPVSWRSILQSTIALSTTEAEYMAATEAVKEAI